MTGRRLTTAATLAALLVVLLGMAAWGFHASTKPFPALGSNDSDTCSKDEISRQTYVGRKQVTVSVYNAGARKGFANLTLSRLEALGFNPGSVGNAPAGSSVARAEVFTTEQDDPAAELVARTLGKNIQIEVTDEDLGPGIDVYVGPKQHLLVPHAVKRVKLDKPIERCLKVS